MEDRKPSLLVELVYGKVGRFFFPNICPLLNYHYDWGS